MREVADILIRIGHELWIGVTTLTMKCYVPQQDRSCNLESGICSSSLLRFGFGGDSCQLAHDVVQEHEDYLTGSTMDPTMP